MKTLYSIIWGQVSDVLRHRIQALDNFKTMNSDADALALLTALEIRLSTFNHRKSKPRHYRRLYIVFTLLTRARQIHVKHTWIGMRMGDKSSLTLEVNCSFTQP